MFGKKVKVHFIGIGGVGMSAIARILISLGYPVSGSDMKRGESIIRLEDEGAKIYIGHKEENIGNDVEVVVTSTAIALTNPEIVEAKNRGIVIIHRSEMLAEIMRLRYGIAISGTHGKTTTTSLVSHLLSEGGLSPTCAIGGKHFNLDSNANLGESRYFVCEADESDGSFLRLSPVIAVVTNIDNDHLDYYQTEEALRSAFLEFISSVPFYGCSFLCFENHILRDIAKDIQKKYYSYGFDSSFDLYATSVKYSSEGTSYKANFLGEDLGDFKTTLLGNHNVLNSLAALGIAVLLGVPKEKIKTALLNFKGVGRRLNLIYEDKNIRVYDDYAHHPTEIKSTLSALKTSQKKKILAVFQPHRYSRTELLFEEFGKCFDDADEVVITDIYPAGELPRPGISGEIIYKELLKNKHKEVYYISGKEELVDFLKSRLSKSRIIITLGAGDIFKVGEEFVGSL